MDEYQAQIYASAVIARIVMTIIVSAYSSTSFLSLLEAIERNGERALIR